MQIPSAQPYQPPVRATKTSSSSEVARSKENASTDATSESNSISGDPFTARAYESVHQALNDLPDSRTDEVARGQALIADPTYPGLSIISKLAELFVGDAQASLVGES